MAEEVGMEVILDHNDQVAHLGTAGRIKFHVLHPIKSRGNHQIVGLRTGCSNKRRSQQKADKSER